MAKITIHDIAKELNVSASTVSRALSDHPKISKKTKERVFHVARELGYHSGVGSVQNAGRKAIALIVPSQESTFLRETIRTLHNEFSAKGLRLLIYQTYESYETEKIYVQEILGLQPKGVIVALASDSPDAKHFQPLIDKKIPLVFFYRVDYSFPVPQVVVDNYDAAYKATKHLIDSGYRRIAHLAGTPNSSVYSEIVKGYTAALEDAGVEFRKDFLIYSDLTPADARECMNRLYGPGTQPNAIFVASNHAAIEVLKYLRNNGISVPNQVGVLSYGYNPAGAFFIPSISTIEQSSEEVASMVFGKLNEMIEDDVWDESTLVSAAKLIIRTSTLPT